MILFLIIYKTVQKRKRTAIVGQPVDKSMNRQI